MRDIVERVARAICDSEPAIEEIHSFEFHKVAYMAAARAAIEAMREPTEAMMSEHSQIQISGYRDMIDTALEGADA